MLSREAISLDYYLKHLRIHLKENNKQKNEIQGDWKSKTIKLSLTIHRFRIGKGHHTSNIEQTRFVATNTFQDDNEQKQVTQILKKIKSAVDAIKGKIVEDKIGNIDIEDYWEFAAEILDQFLFYVFSLYLFVVVFVYLVPLLDHPYY